MLELRYLSRPRVVLDGEVVRDFVSDKALVLLLYLTLNEGPRSRNSLAGLLWGEKPEKRARANLRVALHNLKKLLPGYVAVTRKQVAFAPERPHWIDLDELAEAAEGEGSLERMAEAVALYENEFLSGLHVDGAPALETWLRAERERWRLLLADLLERLAEQYGERRRWSDAIAAARRLLAVEPWRERTHRQLMLLQARQGAYAAALAQYEACRELLAKELGVEPMAETVSLAERIRQLRDRPRHNLPEQPTTFLGRKRELAHLQELLISDEARLVSIVGLGGVGKTRLAVEAAKAAVAHFLEGAFFVSLAGLSSGAYLPGAIAGAVGYRFAGERAQEDQVLDYLGDKEMLLVLDNYEHLLPDTSFLSRLLKAAPALKLLVTSRQRLQLRWEYLVEVVGLPVEAPDPSDLAEAPQLFLAHARRLAPDFDPPPAELDAIGAICRFVHGMPLAIEMAAAEVRILSPSQLAERLQISAEVLTAPGWDAPERHRSMHAVFDHSWQLLPPAERDALARLSVFPASFDLAAAEAVAGATPAIVRSLVDKSLLMRRDGGRPGWHQLLRQYTAAKLKEQPEAAEESVRRHYRHYADMVSSIGMQGIVNPENVKKMEVEMDNVRRAWQAAAEAGDYEILAHTAPGLATFYYGSDRWQDGRRLFGETIAQLRQAVANSEESLPQLERLLAVLLSWQAMYTLKTDLDESGSVADEAVELLRPLDKPANLGHALTVRAEAALEAGRVPEAIDDLEEVLRTVPPEENRILFLGAVHRAALAHLQGGNYERAEAYGSQYLEAARAVGFNQSIAYGLRVLGNAARGHEKDEEAASLLEEALDVARQSGRPTVIGDVLLDLSRLASEHGHFEQARDYLTQLEEMDRLLRDFPSHRRDLKIELGIVAAGLGHEKEAHRHFHEAFTLLRERQQRPRALYLLLHASLLFRLEEPEWAIRAVNLVRQHPASSALTVRRAEEALRNLRSQFPAEVEEAAIARGKGLALESVMAELETRLKG